MQTLNRREFVATSTAATAILAAPVALAAPQQDARKYLLSRQCPPDKIASALIPRTQWKPFPSAADRAAWAELLPDTCTALLVAGEERLKGNWPPLPATLFLE